MKWGPLRLEGTACDRPERASNPQVAGSSPAGRTLSRSRNRSDPWVSSEAIHAASQMLPLIRSVRNTLRRPLIRNGALGLGTAVSYSNLVGFEGRREPTANSL